MKYIIQTLVEIEATSLEEAVVLAASARPVYCIKGSDDTLELLTHKQVLAVRNRVRITNKAKMELEAKLRRLHGEINNARSIKDDLASYEDPADAPKIQRLNARIEQYEAEIKALLSNNPLSQ